MTLINDYCVKLILFVNKYRFENEIIDLKVLIKEIN